MFIGGSLIDPAVLEVLPLEEGKSPSWLRVRGTAHGRAYLVSGGLVEIEQDLLLNIKEFREGLELMSPSVRVASPSTY